MDATTPIKLVRHGAVLLQGSAVVAVDPYALEDGLPSADVIIITHSHFDHYSPRDIIKIARADTRFAVPAEVAQRLRSELHIQDDYITVLSSAAPCTALLGGVTVTPVTAENKNHPAAMGFGAVITLDGFCYYASGDTDILAQSPVCDVLFVCCDGQYNMLQGIPQIVQCVQQMHTPPKLILPYHYDESVISGCGKNGALTVQALRRAGFTAREWQSAE